MVGRVRLNRLQEYPSATLAAACESFGLDSITPEDLAAAIPKWKHDEHGKKNLDHLSRVRFFFDNPSDDDDDAILLCNGRPYRQPDLDEPHFYDGMHRFAAAVLRGDNTIKVKFRWCGATGVFLSYAVIAYLIGESDIKPSGAQSRASASE